MTISITITDGTNTVTLSGTDAYCENYQPVTPELGDENVVETLEVTFFGGISTVDANLAKLERLFQEARDRQDGGTGMAPVYLKVALDGAEWRSKIYDGKVISTPDWIKGERALGVRQISLIIQRAPWWEASVISTCLLTNGNGAGVAPINIFNCNDGIGSSPNLQNNWVSIPGAQVTGDLPAPAIIFVDRAPAFENAESFFIANNVYSDPATLVTWYEGETGTGDTTDSNSSGGKYHTFNGATLNIAKDITAEARRLKGGAYRVLARMVADAGFKIRPYFLINDYWFSYGPAQTVVAAGAMRNQDLGIIFFDLAKFNDSSYAYASLDMGFEAVKSTAGNISLDSLQLTPLDGWRHLRTPQFTSWPSPANSRLMLDETEGIAYLTYSNNYLRPVTAIGSPILLYPGVENRLFFLWEALTAITKSVIDVQYRQRRRAL